MEAISKDLEIALKKTPFTYKFLVQENNLDHRKLNAYIQKNIPANAVETYSEIDFLDRLTDRLCIYIIKYVKMLPAINQEMLNDTRNNAHQNNDILLSLSVRIEEIADQTYQLFYATIQAEKPDIYKEFEVKYKETMVSRLDVMRTYRSAQSGRPWVKHNLASAYVSMNSKDHQDSSIKKLDEIIDTKWDKIYLVAHGGLGKSTWLSHIALQIIKGETLPDYIPFLIRLREDFDRLEHFENLDLLTKSILGDNPPQNWVYEILEKNQAVLLIDGIDEIDEIDERPANKYRTLYNWIKNLIEQYPQTKIIITSRPNKISHPGLRNLLDEFLKFEIQPLDMHGITNLIDKWHDTAINENIWNHSSSISISEKKKYLLNRLKFDETLRNLAETPLSCAMLCAINLLRKQNLPRNRVELYKLCAEMLIEVREHDKGLEESSLSLAHKYALLGNIAYTAFLRNYESPIKYEVAITAIRDKIQSFPKFPYSEAEDILDYLIRRSSVLTRINDKEFKFIHETFKEFFAAKEIVNTQDGGDIGYLLTAMESESKRNIVIFATGLALPHTCNTILDKVIEKGDQSTKNKKMHYYILAAMCYQVANEVKPKLQEIIEAKVGSILPPKNSKEAQDISYIGDFVIPLLNEYNQPRTLIQRTKYIIECLAHIGTEYAVTALSSYKEFLYEFHESEQQQLANMLYNALEIIYYDKKYYSKEELFEKFFSHPEIETLTFSQIENFDGIRALEYLKNLTIDTYYPQAIKQISYIPNLEKLTITTHYEDWRNLDALTNFENHQALQELTLYDFKTLTNIEALAKIPFLKVLEMHNFYNLAELSPLEGFVNLVKLKISTTSRLKDLRTLSKLSNLRYLVLENLDSVEYIEPLAYLQKLDFLSLERCINITDVSPLNNLENLRELCIAECKRINSIASLYNLSEYNLEIIWIDRYMKERLQDLSLFDDTKIDIETLE